MELNREDFISQYPPLYLSNKEKVSDVWNKEHINLYIHIPYCIKKCGFCYYKSFASQTVPDDYFDLLLKEIDLYSKMPQIQSKVVNTLYFGGGTPTLLNQKQIDSLVNTLYKKFNFPTAFEFCCEARPGSETSYEKLLFLKSLGMNRISVGCQSLDDNVLKINQRNHSANEFLKTFSDIRKANIKSVNVDLMTGLFNQSFNSWISTVQRIIDLRPENIAVYKFQLYYNNHLFKEFIEKKLDLISDEEEAMYAKEGYNLLLNTGYIFADNFSFAINSSYIHEHRRDIWRGGDMLGVGLSAHSCINDYIYQNYNNISQYSKLIGMNKLPIQRAHRITKHEEMVQRIVFGIKSTNYDIRNFESEFGIPLNVVFGDKIEYLYSEGFINIIGPYITTTFKGALYADDIVRIFYPPEHKNFMLGHVKRSSTCRQC